MVNYFGFNINPSISLNKYSKRGIHVLLDNSHQMPTNDSLNDTLSVAQIFSLWKTLPVADGGILVYNNFNYDLKVNKKKLKINLKKYVAQKIQLLFFLTNLNFLFFKDKIKANLRAMLSTTINHKNFTEGPCNSAFFLKYYDFERAEAARKNNYKYLVKNLKKIRNIKIMFEEMPSKTIPFTLPISVKNAKNVVNQIRKYGIECFMWPYEDLPTQINIDNYEVLKYWYQNVIHLPIQQNLKRKHLDKIIYAIDKTTKS